MVKENSRQTVSWLDTIHQLRLGWGWITNEKQYDRIEQKSQKGIKT